MKHLKIKIEKLEFQGDLVLRDIDLTINQNDKISIVGPNGSGKTSCMKVIVGEINAYDGFIENVWNMSLGYLHQVYSDDEERTVHEELREAFMQVQTMQEEIWKLETQMESSSDADIIEKYSSLLEQFNNIWWYDFENKIHGVAQWIWVLELLEKKLSEISGGQRTKVALAKVLLQAPDILFLDEPTNFIDMSSVEWLENYLQNKWNWWYVIVSHDREFLDKTCNKTLEIQPQRAATMYHSWYTDYVIEREKVEKIRNDDWVRQQEYIGKQENLINRFRAGSRAGWAKSREKMIGKMEKLEKPFIPKKPKFFFEYSWESPEKMLVYRDAFIGRSDSLFFIPDITLHKWMRVWVVWENGVGKSTFIKTILGQIPLLEWYQSVWKASEILYYSQMHEELHRDLTMRENFHKHGIAYPDEHLIWLIKHYLFEKTDLDKKVSELSGGQTSKLLFAILGQKKSNLLIFDEPTNHLDYDTRESLESSLKNYDGTILFISHDRYFVNKLATHVWFIHDGELSLSYGNYEDYRFKLEHKIDMDMHLFDEEAELNLVLEDKLWEKTFKRLKDKFSKDKKKRRR